MDDEDPYEDVEWLDNDEWETLYTDEQIAEEERKSYSSVLVAGKRDSDG